MYFNKKSMRFIVFLMFWSVCLLGAKPQQGQQVAKAYVTWLLEGNLEELELHAQLSPWLLEKRKNEIIRHLETKGRFGFDGLVKTQCLDIVEDEDLAMALVIAEHSEYIFLYKMYLVAMVHTQGAWKAAPLWGSFANVGLPYDKPLRERAKKLEQWGRDRAKAYKKKRQEQLEERLAFLKKEKHRGAFIAGTPESFIRHIRQGAFIEALCDLGDCEGDLELGRQETLELLVHASQLNIPFNRNAWALLFLKDSILLNRYLEAESTGACLLLSIPQILHRRELVFAELCFQGKSEGKKAYIHLPSYLYANGRICIKAPHLLFYNPKKSKRSSIEHAIGAMCERSPQRFPPCKSKLNSQKGALYSLKKIVEQSDFRAFFNSCHIKGSLQGKEAIAYYQKVLQLWRRVKKLEEIKIHYCAFLTQEKGKLLNLTYVKKADFSKLFFDFLFLLPNTKGELCIDVERSLNTSLWRDEPLKTQILDFQEQCQSSYVKALYALQKPFEWNQRPLDKAQAIKNLEKLNICLRQRDFNALLTHRVLLSSHQKEVSMAFLTSFVKESTSFGDFYLQKIYAKKGVVLLLCSRKNKLLKVDETCILCFLQGEDGCIRLLTPGGCFRLSPTKGARLLNARAKRQLYPCLLPKQRELLDDLFKQAGLNQNYF